MDVPTVAAAGSSPGESTAQLQDAVAPQAEAPLQPASQHGASQTSGGPETLASVVAKLYNLSAGSSGQTPQLSVSYKYVNQLQLVVTVFTNPATGEQIQFPPQELIGLAEMFDQIDGVTLDRKV